MRVQRVGREALPRLTGRGGPIPGPTCAASATADTRLGFRQWVLCKLWREAAWSLTYRFALALPFSDVLLPSEPPYWRVVPIQAGLCQGMAGPAAPIAFSPTEPSRSLHRNTSFSFFFFFSEVLFELLDLLFSKSKLGA